MILVLPRIYYFMRRFILCCEERWNCTTRAAWILRVWRGLCSEPQKLIALASGNPMRSRRLYEIYFIVRFFLWHSRRKKKAWQKRNAVGVFRSLRRATAERGGSAKPFEKGLSENLSDGLIILQSISQGVLRMPYRVLPRREPSRERCRG